MGVNEAPPRPDKTCWNCGADKWWLRPWTIWGKAEWVCGEEHPNPNEKEEASEQDDNTLGIES